MDEPILPTSVADLRDRFVRLREARRERQAKHRAGSGPRRRRPTLSERQAISRKTGDRCHICGGSVGTRWQADHVLAHAGGGMHSVENYLAAHVLCNNYRWDYDPEEFQWVLKIGVWARKQMEGNTELGERMLSGFFDYETRRAGRRRDL